MIGLSTFPASYIFTNDGFMPRVNLFGEQIENDSEVQGRKFDHLLSMLCALCVRVVSACVVFVCCECVVCCDFIVLI